jgi:hypothetical protein
MASEDSDQITSGCPAVHGLRDFRDLSETVRIEMTTVADHAHAARELLEIKSLSCMQRMSLEERNYCPEKLISAVDDELGKVFTMVVVTLIDKHTSHTEEALKPLQCRSPADTLRHHEPMRNLIPGFVAFPARSVTLPNKADGEATLSIYKAHYPSDPNQPFLLVFCTHDIVTVPPAWDGTRSLGYSDVPAYGRMRTARLPARGATIHLRTVPAVTTRTRFIRVAGAFLAGSRGRPRERTISSHPRSEGCAWRIVSEDSNRLPHRPGHRSRGEPSWASSTDGLSC